jgi:hypothetical protein
MGKTMGYPAIYKSIPYLRCYEESGMIETEQGVYSRGYQIVQPEKAARHSITAKQVRAAMENIIRKLSERFTFQFFLCSTHMEQEEFIKSVEIKGFPQGDSYEKIRESYNAVIRDNCEIGHNNFSRGVYLIISTTADTPEDAHAVFESSDTWIKELFASLYGYVAQPMSLTDRLRLLHRLFHSERDAPEFGKKVDYDGNGFSIASMLRMKMTTKEVIAPESYECSRDYAKIGGSYVRLFFLSSIPASVPDSILNDLANVSSHALVSVSYEPLDALLGLETAAARVRENTSTREIPIRDTVADRKSHRMQRQEETKRDTEDEYFYKAAMGTFLYARARQEPVMQITVLIALYAEQRDDLERDSKLLKLSAAKYLCQIRSLDLQQDKAFGSVLPLNNMLVNAKRVYTIEQSTAFQPLQIQRVFERVRTFYGLNAINDNLIFLDRNNYVSALIAGAGGMGKTFALKREATNTLISTMDDVVILTGNPAEYRSFADALQGVIYPGLCVDIFDKGESYNLDEDKRVFQKIFLEAWLSMKLEYHKRRMPQEELRECLAQSGQEAELLCGMATMQEALAYAKDNPDSVRGFIKSLGQISLVNDCFAPRGRLSIVGYESDAGLLEMLDCLWDYAVKAKKKNKTIWLFVDEIDPLMYSTPGSDYVISLIDKAEKIKVPVTLVLEDAAQIAADESAMIEMDYLIHAVKCFRLLSMGPIERKHFIDCLNISEQMIPYFVQRGPGEGIIVTPSANIAFNDRFESRDNPFYQIFY